VAEYFRKTERRTIEIDAPCLVRLLSLLSRNNRASRKRAARNPAALRRDSRYARNDDGRKLVLALATLSLVTAAGVIYAQASGLTRTLVEKADVSVPGREAAVARVELAPSATAGRHTVPVTRSATC
jgi:hypothetical protein